MLENKRILVVEDQFWIAESICEMLQDLSCEPLGPVADTSSARELAQDERPDVVLLDVMLRDGAADDLSRRLRELDLPVIVMTGYDRDMLGECYEGLPCLTKPFEQEQLGQAIEDVLGQHGTARGG